MFNQNEEILRDIWLFVILLIKGQFPRKHTKEDLKTYNKVWYLDCIATSDCVHIDNYM